MKIVLNNEKTKNKDLVFYENFWTGKRQISYDGVELTKVAKNLFQYKNGETVEEFEVKGSILYCIVIKMFGQEIELARKFTWWEIALSVLPFVACLIFCFMSVHGSVWLCILSGALCGAFGGVLSYFLTYLLRQVDKIYFKIIFAVLLFFASFLISYIISVLIFHVCILA